MKAYKVNASSINGTYTAGSFYANTKQEACELAKTDYQNSRVGRRLKDVGAFRFYVVQQELAQ